MLPLNPLIPISQAEKETQAVTWLTAAPSMPQVASERVGAAAAALPGLAQGPVRAERAPAEPSSPGASPAANRHPNPAGNTQNTAKKSSLQGKRHKSFLREKESCQTTFSVSFISCFTFVV